MNCISQLLPLPLGLLQLRSLRATCRSLMRCCCPTTGGCSRSPRPSPRPYCWSASANSFPAPSAPPHHLQVVDAVLVPKNWRVPPLPSPKPSSPKPSPRPSPKPASPRPSSSPKPSPKPASPRPSPHPSPKPSPAGGSPKAARATRRLVTMP